MHASELKKVKTIFAEAIELYGAERMAFLDEACADDQELRDEVSAYLSAADSAGDSLESPPATLCATPAFPGAQERLVGSTIGPYRIMELIGQGGFGSVYMAEQQRPVKRSVALKIIKLGMDTHEVIARFEAERQALAMMEHPNIARVFDAGATDSGRPYFAMELVRGVPITEYCDIRALNTTHRLELFMTVCQAIQHAHLKGVIHRDIKPSNVLVTRQGEIAVPKVIDFGIAKATDQRLTERPAFTQTCQSIGTPAYMSPEQTGAIGQDVDTRSDIYSLGVLLYELLTGTTPFNAKELGSMDSTQAQRMIAEVDPPRPSTRLSAMGLTLEQVAACRSEKPQKLRQLIRGELDWIVMRALEKDRTRRYQSASELARDIVRYLKNEPIEAGPPSLTYRARKFIRRNRPAVLTSAAFVIVLIASVAVYFHGVNLERRKTLSALGESVYQRDEARKASTWALAAEEKANADLVLAAITQGHGARTSSRAGRRFDSLKLLADAARISPNAAVRSQAIACLGLADMRITQQWSSENEAVCFNHSCSQYADCTSDGEVLIYRVPVSASAPPQLLLRISGHVWRRKSLRESSARVVFSPDDQLIAVSHDDAHVRIYRIDGKLVREIDRGPACDFMPDGTAIVTCYPFGTVSIVDISSGKTRKEFYWPGANSISVSPDGQRVAMWSFGRSSDMVVGNIASESFGLFSLTGRISRVAWHPNRTMLAIAEENHLISICDVTDVTHGRVLRNWGSHAGPVISVEYSLDGNLLASSSQDGTVRLFDTQSNEQLVRLFCTGIVRFRPDNQVLSVASYGGKHSLVEVARGSVRRSLAAPTGDRAGVTFSPDGAVMACDGLNSIRFWNLTQSGLNKVPVDLPVVRNGRSVAFHPEGKAVYICTDDGLFPAPIDIDAFIAQTARGDATTSDAIGSIGEALVSRIATVGARVEISRDGRFAVVAQWGRDPLIVDLKKPFDPKVLRSSLDAFYVSISPDGKWVATGSWNGTEDRRVKVWDAQSGQLIVSFPVALDANVAFSPDNHWLVTATAAEYRFWEVGNWEPRQRVLTNSDVPGQIAFSPDSRMVAVSSAQMGVRLIDVQTTAEIATLDDEGDERPLAFSPDGSHLATRGRNNTIRLWDLRQLRGELAKMGLDWQLPPLSPEKARQINPVKSLTPITAR